jgi:hypothetical protein
MDRASVKRRTLAIRGLALLMLLFAGSMAARAAAQTVDQTASRALTDYLRKHRLPLVGGQVSTQDDGRTEVVLYGFVATEQGKRDAERKTLDYLNQPDAKLVNRIVVKPEIQDLGANQAAEQATASDSGGLQGPASGAPLTWDKLIKNIQSQPIRTAPDPAANAQSQWGP